MCKIGLEGVDYINQEPKLEAKNTTKKCECVFHCVNASVQISGLGKIYFYVFERSVLCSRLMLKCLMLYLIKDTVKTVIL